MRVIRNLLRTHKEIIISVILCVVGVGGILFGVVPTVRVVITAISDIRVLDAVITRLDQKAVGLDALSEDNLRDQLSVITAAIPTDKAVPSIFATVDRVAEASGVEVVDMAVTQAGSLSTASAQKLSMEEKTLGASLLPLSVTLRGSYDAIRGFIGRIGSVRRLLRIRSFDIAIITPGVVQARLALDAFYLSLPSTFANVDQPLVELTREEQDVLAKLASYPLVSQISSGTLRPPSLGTKQNPFAK